MRTIAPISTSDIRRQREYADMADHLLHRHLVDAGIAADSMDAAAGGITMADRAAIGVALTLARQSHRSYGGAEILGLAAAQGHVFESPVLARIVGEGAVVADEAPVGRDTDRIGTFAAPRLARPLLERVPLYTPADDKRVVRHDEVVESFQSVVFTDSGEELPMTQPPKYEVHPDQPLFLVGYKRSANWNPLANVTTIHSGPMASTENESLLGDLEKALQRGSAVLPACKSLASDPRTLQILEHKAADGVTYSPSSAEEQDKMLNDFKRFLFAIVRESEGAFEDPDTMFVGYGVQEDMTSFARSAGLDSSTMQQIESLLRGRGVEIVPTPGINRRIVATRLGGPIATGLLRLGDQAPRLMHTYTDRHGTHSVVAMRFGGLYSVFGGQSIAMGAPA